MTSTAMLQIRDAEKGFSDGTSFQALKQKRGINFMKWVMVIWMLVTPVTDPTVDDVIVNITSETTCIETMHVTTLQRDVAMETKDPNARQFAFAVCVPDRTGKVEQRINRGERRDLQREYRKVLQQAADAKIKTKGKK